MGQLPLVGQALLIIEGSLSPWTWQHTTLKADMNATGGIRTCNSSIAVLGVCLRPRGHWDRHWSLIPSRNAGLLKKVVIILDVTCGANVTDTELNCVMTNVMHEFWIYLSMHFCIESFVFQIAIQKLKDQDI
jgi:hypothetical protein